MCRQFLNFTKINSVAMDNMAISPMPNKELIDWISYCWLWLHGDPVWDYLEIVWSWCKADRTSLSKGLIRKTPTSPLNRGIPRTQFICLKRLSSRVDLAKIQTVLPRRLHVLILLLALSSHSLQLYQCNFLIPKTGSQGLYDLTEISLLIWDYAV